MSDVVIVGAARSAADKRDGDLGTLGLVKRES